MYIKIVGDTAKYQGSIERVNAHLIKVSGLIKHTSGFRIYLDNDTLIGDYSTFVYPYEDPNLGEGIYEYSDNNMNYEEESQKPSKEEQERQKIENIISKTVGDEIAILTQQMIELSNIITPMYEVILDIQDTIKPQSDVNITPSEETETVNNIDTQSTDETVTK